MFNESTGPKQGMRGIILIILSTIGLLSNGFVLYVCAKTRKLQNLKIHMWSITRLAAADFLLSFSLLVHGIGSVFDSVIENYFFCILSCQSQIYFCFVSLFVLNIATLDRYIAVCHHDRYVDTVTNRRKNIAYVMAWILPLPIVCMPLRYNYLKTVNDCKYTNIFHEWIYITESVILLIQISINILLFIPIFREMLKFYNRIQKMWRENTHGSTTCTRLKEQRKRIRRGKIVGVLTLVFYLCWMPFAIHQFQFGLEFSENDKVFVFTLIICYICLNGNPILYAWKNEQFRNEVKKLLPCILFQQNSANNEIVQGRTNTLYPNTIINGYTASQHGPSSYPINEPTNVFYIDESRFSQTALSTRTVKDFGQPKSLRTRRKTQNVRPKTIFVMPYRPSAGENCHI